MATRPPLASLVDRVHHPLEAHPALLTTASTYLETGGSLEATARALFVHPNTVRYRLGRIAEITGYDLGHPREAHTVAIALAMGRLADTPTVEWRAGAPTPGRAHTVGTDLGLMTARTWRVPPNPAPIVRRVRRRRAGRRAARVVPVIALVCPGQGSQTPGFLAPWLELPGLRERAEALSDAAGTDLVAHGTTSDADTIRDTAVAQPLIVGAGLLALEALSPGALSRSLPPPSRSSPDTPSARSPRPPPRAC